MAETFRNPDDQTTAGWGWNGDVCAVWGVAIVIGDSREEKERRARIIAEAMRDGANG